MGMRAGFSTAAGFIALLLECNGTLAALRGAGPAGGLACFVWWKVASVAKCLKRLYSERIAQEEMARAAFDTDERSPDGAFGRELDAADEARAFGGFVTPGDLGSER